MANLKRQTRKEYFKKIDSMYKESLKEDALIDTSKEYDAASWKVLNNLSAMKKFFIETIDILEKTDSVLLKAIYQRGLIKEFKELEQKINNAVDIMVNTRNKKRDKEE